MCKITAIVNQKGGVGKTTTTLNLGYALSKMGKKVLLIDFDPQGSLSICLGLDDTDNIKTTIASLMIRVLEEKPLPEKSEYIIHSNDLDFIPCSIELSPVELSIVSAIGRELFLKSIIDEFKNDYDYIFIDCTPSSGLLTANALAACNSVLIPVIPEYSSAKGLEQLLKNILRIKRINPSIEIGGILLTMYVERTKLSREVENIITKTYGNAINIYKTRIPNSVKVGESALNNKTVIEYANDNKVSIAYQELAKEVINNV